MCSFPLHGRGNSVEAGIACGMDAQAYALWAPCAHAGGSGFPPKIRAGYVSVAIAFVMLQRQSNYAKYH